MPSPIAHATIGYAVFEIAYRTRPSVRGEERGSLPWQLAATVGLSLLPDVDSIVGLLAGNLGKYHNNLTHSLFFALAVASVVGVAVSLRNRRAGIYWFALALACYGSHLLADMLTIGRGVMLLWPWNSQRVLSPLSLFYGFHWSDGLWSMRHIWTLVTELGFAALVLVAVHSVPWWPQRIATEPDRLPRSDPGR